MSQPLFRMMRLVANFVKAFFAAAGRVQMGLTRGLDEWTIAQRSGISFPR
jgi:hypothetical protein